MEKVHGLVDRVHSTTVHVVYGTGSFTVVEITIYEPKRYFLI
jgi:hypothetical protein